MERTTGLSKTVEQTTSSSAVLGIVFQKLGHCNGLKNTIKCDVLLNHFLLGMLGDTNILRIGLSTYSLQHSLRVRNMSFTHLIILYH